MYLREAVQEEEAPSGSSSAPAITAVWSFLEFPTVDAPTTACTTACHFLFDRESLSITWTTGREYNDLFERTCESR